MPYVINATGWYAVGGDFTEADLAPGEVLVDELTSEIVAQIKANQLLTAEAWKERRAQAVAAITVTTDQGHTFDGDEISQGRMARAIISMQFQPEGSTVQWVLHDNTVLDIGVEELREALTLAGLRQTELWVRS